MWVIVAILACLGVAVFVMLPISSSLGTVCGPNGNFSVATGKDCTPHKLSRCTHANPPALLYVIPLSLMLSFRLCLADHLLDNPQVWRGAYPLGSLLLGNSSANLTLNSMLRACAGGGSMYGVFQLRYPLHQIGILEQALVSLQRLLWQLMVTASRGFEGCLLCLPPQVTLVDAVGAFAPPVPAVLSPNVSAGLRASLGLPRRLVLLTDFNTKVFGNFSESLSLLTNLTEHLVCVHVCMCIHVCDAAVPAPRRTA